MTDHEDDNDNDIDESTPLLDENGRELDDEEEAQLQNVIDRITDYLGGSQKADEEAEQARDEAGKTRTRTLKDLATFVSGINIPLTDWDIGIISAQAAKRIARGNPAVERVRKSEIKLFLEQRTHVAGVVSGIDTWNRKSDKQVNLRSETLRALRKLRSTKDEDAYITSAKDAVKQFTAEQKLKSAPKSDADAMRGVLEKLGKNQLVLSTSRAKRALDAFAAAVGVGPVFGSELIDDEDPDEYDPTGGIETPEIVVPDEEEEDQPDLEEIPLEEGEEEEDEDEEEIEAPDFGEFDLDEFNSSYEP